MDIFTSEKKERKKVCIRRKNDKQNIIPHTFLELLVHWERLAFKYCGM